MNWKLITIGKPALPWAKAAAEDYLLRLRRHSKVDWVVLRAGSPEEEGERMLAASEKCLRLVLDEKGRAWRSLELVQWVEEVEMQATKTVAVMIGGANGHSAPVREAADVCWSLSELTLQHEVALVVVMEQLYRAGTIRRNEPYHREG